MIEPIVENAGLLLVILGLMVGGMTSALLGWLTENEPFNKDQTVKATLKAVLGGSIIWATAGFQVLPLSVAWAMGFTGEGGLRRGKEMLEAQRNKSVPEGIGGG